MSTLFRDGHVVTMDEDSSELAGGWILAEDGLISAVGDGAAPEAGRRECRRMVGEEEMTKKLEVYLKPI